MQKTRIAKTILSKMGKVLEAIFSDFQTYQSALTMTMVIDDK